MKYSYLGAKTMSRSLLKCQNSLPGCMSDGKTYQEALSNIEIIIEEWIEAAKGIGGEIPEP